MIGALEIQYLVCDQQALDLYQRQDLRVLIRLQGPHNPRIVRPGGPAAIDLLKETPAVSVRRYRDPNSQDPVQVN
jgi:hypothetical protein